MSSYPHQSVLLQEVLEAFKTKQLKIFVDGTLGAGGHAEALLRAHPEIELYIGMDQDTTALEIAKKRLEPWQDKLKLVHVNFQHLVHTLNKLQINHIDGMLLDLGVSSMQLDQAEKGFSFMREGPLDMRMDPTALLTAADIVNEWPESDLAKIFRDYGEEKQWRRAAQAIIQARSMAPITTTKELADVLMPVLSWKKKGLNPLTLIFQGLRIAVNDELQVIEKVIPSAIERLSSGGRLAIITFHSLEDRIVKNSFRYAADDKESSHGIGGIFIDKEPLVNLVTRKPIAPSENEIADNPRSRSAKLRVVEKR